MRNWQTSLAKQTRWRDGDVELFKRFARDASEHQISDRRIDKYRTDMTIANEMTGMGMCEMTGSLEGLKKACCSINNDKQYSFETKHDAKRTLGSLYCFVNVNNRSMRYAPMEVRDLVKHQRRGSDKRLARAVMTREEIREMTKHANNTMDKALIWLLFETGMRNGEFEQLRKRDITQIDEGLLVKVPAGKTGERIVVVVEAAKFVNAWLAGHPLKGNDAPLWYGTKGGKKLTQGAIAKRIRNVAAQMNEYRQKNGIPKFSKDVNPHNFRHSRASELGGEQGMTEQILCKYFGWEIGSAMPRTYLHLTDEQVRRAVLRTYGKAKKEEDKEIMTSWVCPRCKEDVPLALNYCGRCGGSKEGKVISLTEKMRQELEATRSELKAMKKNQAAQDKEMEGIARKLAAITINQARRSSKAAIGDKG